MEYQSLLKRMPVELTKPVTYYLDMEEDFIILNNLIGKDLEIEFEKYQCLSCGEDLPIFAQGLCKKCFFESPHTGDWVMKPELSKAHLNIEDRNLEYEREVQLQPHFVYLAKTSDIKVGVTRHTQIPTRWIDQGADEAMVIMETPNRFIAGQIEVFLKQYLTDKTGWQKMLKGISTHKELLSVREEVKNLIPEEFKKYWVEDSKPVQIEYPVLKYPEKIKSLNLEKVPKFSKKLVGIKGQYLVFEDGSVFNVRNHSGYVVNLKF